MHEELVNRLGGLSLPRKSVVRLTDRPDMTSDVYRERKTTIQQQQQYTFVTISLTKSCREKEKWIKCLLYWNLKLNHIEKKFTFSKEIRLET